MKLTHVGLIVLLSVIGAATSLGEAQSGSRERFVCTFGGGQRFIDIYRLASGGPRSGCRVDYTRNGVTTRVWSANADYAYCVKKAVGLVTKLSKGNFSCKPQTAEQPSVGGSTSP